MLPSVQKLNERILFNNDIFTRVSYTIWGAYEIKTTRNNNVRNIFNVKYNQIMVFEKCSILHYMGIGKCVCAMSVLPT